ncbi:pyridoxamine 5'-phosphate oxidase family protein [Pseudofrankia inefficax]|uniref:Pyridoxamine 5'-phosphate oxidase-related FMN-binding protein n=1 Tax=Pseudofrankia inefficax (strain DSM 45817 / CECT 9037 / DDB 130130 / EuI1c) TaxID=298654 RepID=E3IXP8_PSEI1|nr:pyridoxamine 5'-phosphate oxidase family protein [Pseudofrankia inefficax]ADP80207.1 pyridoxamine 5'-phosphate oxidase-related FMN-binding protein [Pseudofrankia inefficax]
MLTVDAHELARTALDLLRRNPYGFLTTVAGGVPHTRLVQHLAVEDDATVWIGTSPRSRKAAEVADNAQVCFAVEDRAAFAYVAVQATSSLVHAEEERVARWREGLEAFFPDGPRGDDFVLLRLAPVRLELMSFVHGVHPDPYGLLPAVLGRSDDGWAVLPARRE